MKISKENNHVVTRCSMNMTKVMIKAILTLILPNELRDDKT
jgi:hypothetical protein